MRHRYHSSAILSKASTKLLANFPITCPIPGIAAFSAASNSATFVFRSSSVNPAQPCAMSAAIFLMVACTATVSHLVFSIPAAVSDTSSAAFAVCASSNFSFVSYCALSRFLFSSSLS